MLKRRQRDGNESRPQAVYGQTALSVFGLTRLSDRLTNLLHRLYSVPFWYIFCGRKNTNV